MAATSVLKLVVDDKEYSASLKNAKQGMQDLQTSLQSAGKSFLDVDNKVVEYARALGQMDTVSKTAKGRIGEMSSAFVELSVQYKHMTDQEKQSPVGKALAESLGTLKTRVIDAKNELKEFEDQLREVSEVKIDTKSGDGGLFGGGKLDGMLQVFGGNLMTKGASMLAGLAADMGDMVKQGVEMAKAGEGIRIAFERLNKPGLLDNLREATHGTVTNLELMKAAVKFNDFKLPVEELGTMLAFAQQKAKDTGQSVDYMVDSIVTGLGRKSLMILDNLGLSATEIKDKMKDTGDMTKAVGAIIREQMAKAGDYVETAADRATRADVDLKNAMEDLGRTFQPLSDTGTSMFNSLKVSALNLLNSAIKPLIQAFTQLGAVQKIQDNVNGGGFIGRITNNLQNANNKDFVYSQQMMHINRAINKAQSNLSEAEKGGKGSIEIYRNRLQALINIRDEYERVAQSIMKTETDIATGGGGGGSTGKGGGKGGGGGANIEEAILRGWQNASNRSELAADSFKAEAQPSELFKMLYDSTHDTTDSMGDLTKALERLNEAEGISGKGKDTRKNDETSALKEFQKSLNKGGEIMGGVNSIASGIEQLGVELPQGLRDVLGGIQGIMSIVQGITSILLVIEALNEIQTTTSAIPFFSRGGVVHAAGGIVAGNTYSNDQIPAMLNAGEVVLNRAQAGVLASAIQDNGGGNGRIVGVLRGEDIALVADRWGRRTGKGELAFFK